MTRVQHHTPDTNMAPLSTTKSTTSTSLLHLCTMCGCHFTHLFAYKRHLLRQHWFEAQKQFNENAKIDGLTDKQSQKLQELYRKLKERNSPTPPKRSRRSKPSNDNEPYTTHRAPKVANLKEYKLVTVDDMSEAYRDKYNNPGGYTIFHFKVPKKNTQVTSPPLTALKKTYHTSDQKTAPKTEKIPIRTTSQLSTWQQKSFEQHLTRGINHNISRGVNSLVLSNVKARDPSRDQQMTSRDQMTTHSKNVTSLPDNFLHNTDGHVGCEKCRNKQGTSTCTRACGNSTAAPTTSGWTNLEARATLPLHFISPLLNHNFNCTDILQRIITAPDTIPKPEISVTTEDKETKVDVMNIDLSPVLPQQLALSTSDTANSPSTSSRSDNSPCSSRDLPAEPVTLDTSRAAGHVTHTREHLEILAQIGLQMVHQQLHSQPT